jgi:hypothetical protein
VKFMKAMRFIVHQNALAGNIVDIRPL